MTPLCMRNITVPDGKARVCHPCALCPEWPDFGEGAVVDAADVEADRLACGVPLSQGLGGDTIKVYT